MDFINQLSGSDWILLYVSALIVGFAKTGITGIGILAVPFFAMVFPRREVCRYTSSSFVFCRFSGCVLLQKSR